MKLKIEQSLLSDPIKLINGLVGEAEIVVSQEGVNLIALDAANVSLVVFKLPSSSFVQYDVSEGETKIGVNLNNLKTVLKRAQPEDFVSLELVDNQLMVVLGQRKKYALPTIEIEGKPQKVPDLKFTAKITMPTSSFQEMIEDTDIIAESISLEVKDDLKAMVTAEGDLSKANIEILPMTDEKAKTRTAISCDKPAKSKYSLEYLKKMCSTKLASEVVIHFADDYPMKLVYVHDRFTLNLILAPRVENSP